MRIRVKLPRPGTPERRLLAAQLREMLATCSREEVARELGVCGKSVWAVVNDGKPKAPREKIRAVPDGPRCKCGLRLFGADQLATGRCGDCLNIDRFAGARRAWG